jgi:hypothetical protein
MVVIGETTSCGVRGWACEVFMEVPAGSHDD